MPLVAPAKIVSVSPLLSVTTRSVCGALSTLAVIVMSAPSLTSEDAKVTVVVSVVSFTVTVDVSVVTRFSKLPPDVLLTLNSKLEPST